MKVRSLNSQGIRQFEEFIELLRAGSKQNIPSFLLEDPSTSDAISDLITVEKRNLSSRFELGEYLVDALRGVNIQPYIGDRGFWSWLGLYWFDQLCPDLGAGSREPQMAYSYILSDKWKHRPRHAIYTTWQLVDQYGEASRFLLSRELPVRGELIEQMMARQYLIGCDGVIRLASHLYYDVERKTFKRGAAARKSAGCVARYVNWLQQLEINYDLYSITSQDLEKLLPAEFARFRGAEVN